MKTQSRRKFLKGAPVGIAAAVMAGRALRGADAGAGGSLVENLVAVHEGVMKSQALYAAFAKKADEDGFTQVGSLFRAAARSEQVNREDLEAVIKKLGGTAKTEAKGGDCQGTKQNLEAALKAEKEDHEDRFPALVAQARKEKHKEALRVFNYCKNSQAEHISLFEEALANLEKWKGGTKTFYVCKDCGLTVAALPEEKCPSCLEPISHFVKQA